MIFYNYNVLLKEKKNEGVGNDFIWNIFKYSYINIFKYKVIINTQ